MARAWLRPGKLHARYYSDGRIAMRVVVQTGTRQHIHRGFGFSLKAAHHDLRNDEFLCSVCNLSAQIVCEPVYIPGVPVKLPVEPIGTLVAATPKPVSKWRQFWRCLFPW